MIVCMMFDGVDCGQLS